MKSRVPASILVFLLLLACGGIVVACGGGGGGGGGGGEGGQSLEEYFQALTAVKDDLGAKANAAEEEFPTAFQESAATRDYLVETTSIIEEAVDALRAIDPPQQVQSAHSDFIDALAASQELWAELVDELGDAPSLSDVADISERYGPDLDAASARFETTCSALEDIATANGIDVDLECQ
jgi:hypothetical protein